MSVTSCYYFTFQWPVGPQEVNVAGEFNDWKEQKPLVKKSDGSFALELPVKFDTTEKIHFKYIVDGNWVLNDKYKKEVDATGFENNYLVEADSLSKKTTKRRVKIKKRIRRNKKTGERMVVSEEVILLDDDEKDEKTSESTTSISPTPESEGSEAIANVPVVVVNAEGIKEFKEVSEVSAEQLNKTLNHVTTEDAAPEYSAATDDEVEKSETEEPNDIGDVGTPAEELKIAGDPLIEDGSSELQEEGNDEEGEVPAAVANPKSETSKIESVKKIAQQDDKNGKKGLMKKLKKIFK